METKLEDKSTNEILFEIKQMEADHEGYKLKMLELYDKMESVEGRYNKANEILLKRLKTEIK